MSLRNQTLGLAGVFQAADLVRTVATTGDHDMDARAASIGSVFDLDPESTEAAFGNLGGVKLGLEVVIQAFADKSVNNATLRYAIMLLALERQVQKRPKLMHSMRLGIESAQRQAEHFGEIHENAIAQLADVYVQHISALRPRIIVNGKPLYLEQPRVVASIRSLLLAGVRAAFLYTQNGGSRWQLLFKRGKFVEEARSLLREIGIRH